MVRVVAAVTATLRARNAQVAAAEALEPKAPEPAAEPEPSVAEPNSAQETEAAAESKPTEAAKASEVGEVGEAAKPGKRKKLKRSSAERSADDTDTGWGERPRSGDEHDRWLEEQRPPHWE
ncbi:MAG: hypothetical protein BWY91_00288 [bacterium ADurb.BinA028]|nr:MAG: hypothetical protein BWY91_00288 [bacterium ADurb.BinA028]